MVADKMKSSVISFDEMNTEITTLQDDYAREFERMETMGDVCKVAHDQHDYLRENMPEGHSVNLVVAHPLRHRAVALKVERRGVRIFCSDFQIYEIAGNAVTTVFDRYAAA